MSRETFVQNLRTDSGFDVADDGRVITFSQDGTIIEWHVTWPEIARLLAQGRRSGKEAGAGNLATMWIEEHVATFEGTFGRLVTNDGPTRVVDLSDLAPHERRRWPNV